mgnify:CR=1 FL=1
MYKKIEGIVVSEYSYEEASKIIKIFTKDGIIDVIAKGAKKIKSPFFSVTSKLSYGIFNISYKDNGLSKLVDADILNDYRNIKKDISRVSYATYITELVVKVYKHDNNSNIFDLYIQCLDKISSGYDALIISDILRLKLLDYLGIKPVIDRCACCGNTNDIVTISSYYGGLVCINCLKQDKIVSTKTINLIRGLYFVDISRITKIDISSDIRREIDEFIDDYYDRYSGIYLKSKIFLESIK